METEKKIKINQERLWSDLLELGKIGYQKKGQGVTRTALSEADIIAKDWLSERMKAAGLTVRVDAACNVIGTLKTGEAKSKKVAAMGSHLDTVPNGGMFDGALGVLGALECVRVIRENQIQLPWDLEIINFCDEEAAHNAGTVGSRAMLGMLQKDEIYRAKAKGIPTFAIDMERMGKDPARIGEARRNPNSFRFFLELHIEQGSLLESKELRVAAVIGIAGIYRYLVTVSGEAAHAGTTPMSLRNDALVNGAPVFTLLPQWVKARNTEMVGTIGQVTIEPGVTNVVPGLCRFVVELRSQVTEDMGAIRDLLRAYGTEREGWVIETIYEKDSIALAEPLINHIALAAENEGLAYTCMTSGAGHDAQTFAPFVPTGMVFVPCRGGVSHCPKESIDVENAADGCQVLLRTLLQLANEDRKSL